MYVISRVVNVIVNMVSHMIDKIYLNSWIIYFTDKY